MAKKRQNPSKEGASNNAVDVLEQSDNNQEQPKEKAQEPKEAPLTESERKLLKYLELLKRQEDVVLSVYAKGRSYQKDGITACVSGIVAGKKATLRLEIHPASDNKEVLVGYLHPGKDDFKPLPPDEACQMFLLLKEDMFEEITRIERDTDA
jgi:hypothetical protein